MPKIIDHDKRRDEFAEAVCRLIVREGAAQVTTRQIAAEAGYSTGILAHYFTDKSAVMKYALMYSHREVYKFLDPGVSPGLESLFAFMRACLPLDERRVFLAKVEASYFGLAVGDGELGRIMSKEIDAFHRLVSDIIDAAIEAGELVPRAAAGDLASALRLVMDGISFQVAVGKRVSPQAQLEILDRVVAEYRTDASLQQG